MKWWFVTSAICRIRQYLPSKPTKWDVKVWCLADAKTKWVWAFATKWWHQILFFLLDTSVTNGWLLHRKISKKLGATPLEHYEFLLLMGKTLALTKVNTVPALSRFAASTIHTVTHEDKKHIYMVCKRRRPYTICLQCGVHLCIWFLFCSSP
jgi:hypothetical protein